MESEEKLDTQHTSAKPKNSKKNPMDKAGVHPGEFHTKDEYRHLTNTIIYQNKRVWDHYVIVQSYKPPVRIKMQPITDSILDKDFQMTTNIPRRQKRSEIIFTLRIL